nr:MAG TPA: hypothetical protein [Bacteriophage sp.]
MVTIRKVNGYKERRFNLQKQKMTTIKVNNAVVIMYGKITKEKIEKPTVKYLKKVNQMRKRG